MMNKFTYGRDYDRDKNLTYRPQDESLSIVSASQQSVDNSEDVVTLIRKQCECLCQFADVLQDRRSGHVEKQQALFQLVSLWNSYTQAEENTVYEEVHVSDELVEDRAIAQILIEELEALNFRLDWNYILEKKAQVLAEVIERCFLVEEEKFLQQLRKILSQEDLVMLGREFTRQFEAAEAHNKASLKPQKLNPN